MARSVYNQDDSRGDDGKSYVHNEYDGNNGTMAIKAIMAIKPAKDLNEKIDRKEWLYIRMLVLV